MININIIFISIINIHSNMSTEYFIKRINFSI